ncbi:MAG: NTP transferase domain-containing protein, partial [Alphaproteobacteria bacterium]|nr:NTP transferase domain-containing protein [Alphaproteobacteria bacterium]
MSRTPLCVVILAAGQGTRMKSRLAKVLHPVGGRAMISHVLATAEELGAERTVAVIGKDMQDVADHISPIPTVVQDPPQGTADAVLAAKEQIEGFSGDILVLYGDTPLLTAETLSNMRDVRADKNAAVVVLGFTPEDPAQYGRLVVSEAGGLERIVEYRDCSEAEKAIPLCNAGVMLIDGVRALDLLGRVDNDNAKGEFYLTDIVALARSDGAPCAVVEADADEVTGVNSRGELALAEAIFQQRLRARAMEAGVTLIAPETVYLSADTQIAADVTIHPHVVIGPGVRIAEGAVIEAFSHLDGAEVGEGASIGPYARLRPGAKIGTGARIGNFVEV